MRSVLVSQLRRNKIIHIIIVKKLIISSSYFLSIFLILNLKLTFIIKINLYIRPLLIINILNVY